MRNFWTAERLHTLRQRKTEQERVIERSEYELSEAREELQALTDLLRNVAPEKRVCVAVELADIREKIERLTVKSAQVKRELLESTQREARYLALQQLVLECP